MMLQPQHQVHAWQFQEVLLESYDYGPGKAEGSAPHLHGDYQICLSLDFPGVYGYRGAYHSVPKGSVSVILPNEKHSASDPEDRQTHAHYCLFYVPPSLFQQIVSLGGSRISTLPFFPEPVLLDASLFDRFYSLHQMLGNAIPLLEQETVLHSLLFSLIKRSATNFCPPPLARPDWSTVRRVKEYIEDHYQRNISLNELAQLVERHPVYLNAVFRQSVGVPPHVYQTHIRLDQAKRLLASGQPVGEVAHQVGFYDQSHFGKHFRRYTGVTPSRYIALKPSSLSDF